MTPIPAAMSGVQLTRHGGPEALIWRDDIPVPRPSAGEVLVRVLAAGVNMTDLNTRIGWYGEGRAAGWGGQMVFPRIQGSDLCGRVVALGADVTGFDLGMRVICPTNQHEPTGENPIAFVSIGSEFDGAFAQYCMVKAQHLHDVRSARCPALTAPRITC